ncbi:2-keto-4-pentenoate hydratase [Paenarthrobacter nitroguajacolicus]
MKFDVEEFAAALIDAKETGKPLDELFGKVDLEGSRRDAFRVAQEVVRRKVARGDKVIGFKLGNIAQAMQDKFGVAEADYGYLLAGQLYPESLPIPGSEFIAPFVELEPGFVLKADLGGPHVTVTDVISATDYVVPAVEIIDSRIKDWNIGIFDTMADGGSCGGVILGAKPRKLSEIDLGNVAGEIRFDGKVVATGNTGEICGNPVSAIAWLCRKVWEEYGLTFKAGDLLLAGSCLAAEKLPPGTKVTGSFEGWGDIHFEYTDNHNGLSIHAL